MATTIPVYGNQAFKDALRELAFRRRTTMSKLVRAALDDALGDDLKACFFANDVASTQTSEHIDNIDEDEDA